MQPHSPWGVADSTPLDSTESGSLQFEDSFSSEHISAVTSSNDATIVRGTTATDDEDKKNYMPLPDSSEYLAGLEHKLARLQGKTASGRQKESRRLINALASSREAHISRHLQDDSATSTGLSELNEDEVCPVSSTVDSQGALGLVMRKVVPDKVAVSQEEMYRLLEADFLAKVTQGLHEEEEEEKVTSTKGSLPEEDDRVDNIS
ncbi:uncharacterized protein LOC143041463 [Oratosquilla oratoria]|uniref:uncharacterized protein LOC143041463 n=1 Tax=Oratosquilla oratoria TaxID=337810 RepID=UPI003F75D82C